MTSVPGSTVPAGGSKVGGSRDNIVKLGVDPVRPRLQPILEVIDLALVAPKSRTDRWKLGEVAHSRPGEYRRPCIDLRVDVLRTQRPLAKLRPARTIGRRKGITAKRVLVTKEQSQTSYRASHCHPGGPGW